MKKFGILFITMLTIILIMDYAHAQTGSYPIMTIDHYHNSCEVFVDLDYWDPNSELGITDHDMQANEVNVEVTNYPGSWLYYTMVVATVEVFEDYTGYLTLVQEYYADDQFSTDPEDFILRTTTYPQMVDLQANDPNNNQRTFILSQNFKSSAVWDQTPGKYRDTSINIRLATPVFARLKVDLVRVKKWDDNGPCSAH